MDNEFTILSDCELCSQMDFAQKPASVSHMRCASSHSCYPASSPNDIHHLSNYIYSLHTSDFDVITYNHYIHEDHIAHHTQELSGKYFRQSHFVENTTVLPLAQLCREIVNPSEVSDFAMPVNSYSYARKNSNFISSVYDSLLSPIGKIYLQWDGRVPDIDTTSRPNDLPYHQSQLSELQSLIIKLPHKHIDYTFITKYSLANSRFIYARRGFVFKWLRGGFHFEFAITSYTRDNFFFQPLPGSEFCPEQFHWNGFVFIRDDGITDHWDGEYMSGYSKGLDWHLIVAMFIDSTDIGMFYKNSLFNELSHLYIDDHQIERRSDQNPLVIDTSIDVCSYFEAVSDLMKFLKTLDLKESKDEERNTFHRNNQCVRAEMCAGQSKMKKEKDDIDDLIDEATTYKEVLKILNSTQKIQGRRKTSRRTKIDESHSKTKKDADVLVRMMRDAKAEMCANSDEGIVSVLRRKCEEINNSLTFMSDLKQKGVVPTLFDSTVKNFNYEQHKDILNKLICAFTHLVASPRLSTLIAEMNHFLMDIGIYPTDILFKGMSISQYWIRSLLACNPHKRHEKRDYNNDFVINSFMEGWNNPTATQQATAEDSFDYDNLMELLRAQEGPPLINFDEEDETGIMVSGESAKEKDKMELEKSVYGVLSSFSGLVCAGILGHNIKEDASWEEKMKSFSKIGVQSHGFTRLTDIVFNFIKNAHHLFEKVFHIINGRSELAQVEADMAEHGIQFSIFIDEAIRITQPEMENVVRYHAEKRKNVFDLCRQAGVISSLIATLKVKITPSVEKVFFDVSGKLNKLSASLANSPGTDSYRNEPFVIQLDGLPNSGKSSVATKLAKELIKRLNITVQSEELAIFTHSSLNKHYDSFAGQPVWILDDAFQECDGRENSIYHNMIMIKSNVAFKPPMASINDKGRSAAPKIVILTSNIAYPNTNDIKERVALLRRRDLLVNVKRNGLGKWIFNTMNPIDNKQDFDRLAAGGYTYRPVLNMDNAQFLKLCIDRYHELEDQANVLIEVPFVEDGELPQYNIAPNDLDLPKRASDNPDIVCKRKAKFEYRGYFYQEVSFNVDGHKKSEFIRLGPVNAQEESGEMVAGDDGYLFTRLIYRNGTFSELWKNKDGDEYLKPLDRGEIKPIREEKKDKHPINVVTYERNKPEKINLDIHENIHAMEEEVHYHIHPADYMAQIEELCSLELDAKEVIKLAAAYDYATSKNWCDYFWKASNKVYNKIFVPYFGSAIEMPCTAQKKLKNIISNTCEWINTRKAQFEAFTTGKHKFEPTSRMIEKYMEMRGEQILKLEFTPTPNKASIYPIVSWNSQANIFMEDLAFFFHVKTSSPIFSVIILRLENWFQNYMIVTPWKNTHDKFVSTWEKLKQKMVEYWEYFKLQCAKMWEKRWFKALVVFGGIIVGIGGIAYLGTKLRNVSDSCELGEMVTKAYSTDVKKHARVVHAAPRLVTSGKVATGIMTSSDSLEGPCESDRQGIPVAEQTSNIMDLARLLHQRVGLIQHMIDGVPSNTQHFTRLGGHLCVTTNHFFQLNPQDMKEIRIAMQQRGETIISTFFLKQEDLFVPSFAETEVDLAFFLLPQNFEAAKERILNHVATGEDYESGAIKQRMDGVYLALDEVTDDLEYSRVIYQGFNILPISHCYEAVRTQTANRPEVPTIRLIHGFVTSGALQKGFCGAPLLVNDKTRPRRVIGIASATLSKRGVASILTQEMAQAALSYFIEQKKFIPPVCIDGEMVCKHYNIAYLDEDIDVKTGMVPEKAEIIGITPPGLTERIIPDSAYGQSLLAEFLPPTKKGLPAMVPNDKRVDPEYYGSPIKIASTKFFGPTIAHDEKLLQECVEEIAEHILPYEDPKIGRRLMKVSEVLNGIDGTNFEACQKTTSAGFPWKHKPGSSGKKKVLANVGTIQNPEWKVNDPLFGFALERFEETARKGESVPVVGIVTLKDQPIKLEKVKQNKVRAFTNLPFEFNIMVARYFGAWVMMLQYMRSILPCQVGINANSYDWTDLVNRLKEKGSYGFAADYSDWDGNTSSIHANVWHIQRWYYPNLSLSEFEDMIHNWRLINLPICIRTMHLSAFTGWKRVFLEEMNARHILMRQHFDCFLQIGKFITPKYKSIPSGTFLTAILNSDINWRNHMYVYKQIVGNAVLDDKPLRYSYFDYIADAYYGDDELSIVDPRITHLYNFKSVGKQLEALGLKVTTEFKESITNALPLRELTEMSFIKRTFEKSELHRELWKGPLSKDSIEEQLKWIRIKNQDEITATIVNCSNALREASIVNRLYYNDLAHQISQASACLFSMDNIRLGIKMNYDSDIFYWKKANGLV